MMNFIKIISIYVCLSFSININAQNNEFTPNGKVWGLTFGDFYYKLGGDTIYNSNISKKWGDTEFAKIKKDFIGISIRRLYLGYDYNISRSFIAHTLLDGNDAVLTSGGERTAIIKAANIEWKNIFKNHNLIVGQSSTPSFSISEKTWGYRSVEKVIGDARKLQLSNDLGLKLEGSYDSTKTLNYTFMYATGKSTKPEDNRLKKYYLGFDANFFKSKLIVALNFDYEDQMVEYKKQPMTKTTCDAFLAFKNKSFTLGVEAVYQFQKNYKIFDPKLSDSSSVKPLDSTNVNVLGVSIFIKGNIYKEKLLYFARFDYYTPDVKFQKGDNLQNPYRETFFTLGFDYLPNKNVHFIPNLWVNSYKDMRTIPENYSVINNWNNYYNRLPDIVVRLTFYYLFK